ncbi:MAG: adenylate kinase family protein [Methanoregulaceae archaeon]|jgi:adenylate kinase|nr:adenylate kinase family protein [Methanoregulaceae archaeon]
MMCGITGTPGTGKSSVAEALAQMGSPVLHLSDSISRYIIEVDEERDTRVIDEERWAAEFVPVDGFVEGHLAHLLPCDRIVILRCRPDILIERLQRRGYTDKKIRENALAEALDVILIETVDLFSPEQVYELDTTDKSITECSMITDQFAKGEIPASFGTIDWSPYIGQIE